MLQGVGYFLPPSSTQLKGKDLVLLFYCNVGLTCNRTAMAWRYSQALKHVLLTGQR